MVAIAAVALPVPVSGQEEASAGWAGAAEEAALVQK